MSEQLGVNPLVWMRGIKKRMIEGLAGYGGVEAINRFLANVDFVPDRLPLLLTMKRMNSIFEHALDSCNEKPMKRPLVVREDEVFRGLGYECPKCGIKVSFAANLHLKHRCACGALLKPSYISIMRKMLSLGLDVLPETILMFDAFDRYSEAYVAAYQAINLVFEKTAELSGSEHFRINDSEFKNFLDDLFYGGIKGNERLPAEDKEVLQFIFRGNHAGIKLDEAEKVIRLGVEAEKLGFLFHNLNCIGADLLYKDAVTEYLAAYDVVNSKIRRALGDLATEGRKQIVRREGVHVGEVVACLIMDDSGWKTGQIAHEIVLRPAYSLPVFPGSESGSVQMAYAPPRKGKTLLLESLMSYSFSKKEELIFSPLNDKSDSFAMAGIPLFPYNRAAGRLLRLLHPLGIEPHGIPSLVLTFLMPGEKVENMNAHPPMVFDRVIVVDDAFRFKLDFDLLLDELKGVAEKMGFNDGGVICVRNLNRTNRDTKSYFDVRIATNLLGQFDDWRKGKVQIHARLSIDELSYFCPAQLGGAYGGDEQRAGSMLSDIIKEHGRNRCAVDGSTQFPLELIPEVRDSANNVFFRELPMSKAKDRSQIDFLIDGLPLDEDPIVRKVIKDLNNRAVLGSGFWFWHNRDRRTVEVVQVIPPTFCVLDSGPEAPDTLGILKLYEKRSGEKVLLDSWRNVPSLSVKKGRDFKVVPR